MEDKLTKAERKALRKQERYAWEEKLHKEQNTKVFKKIAIWTLAAIATALCGWGIIALTTASSTPSSSLIMPPLTSTDIGTGPKNANITLVEYADFQCPTCGLYHPIVKQLLKDFNGKIYFIYRFFPLPTIHRNAMAASQAGYAASLQGKFWEMHDMLFEHQNDWAESATAEDTFVTYAKALGLDTDTFTAAVAAPATRKFIDTEENAGTAAGVQGTPTFFLNGKQIDNPQGYDAFKRLIEQQLKK